MGDDNNSDLLNLTADIVTAHVSNNMVTGSDIPAIIESVFATLSRLGSQAEVAEKQEPAVSIRASVKPDYIVCLEDGKKLKMLKRHLMANYNLTPAEYRAKWNLPSDYPMVAPNYAAVRRKLAKAIGLGRKPAAAAATAGNGQGAGADSATVTATKKAPVRKAAPRTASTKSAASSSDKAPAASKAAATAPAASKKAPAARRAPAAKAASGAGTASTGRTRKPAASKS